MKVKVKKLNPEAIVPKYAKAGDAGLDLVAITARREGAKIVYGTGLAFEIPEGHVGLIFPRSSVHKSSMRLSNCVGVIDSGYRGEVMAVFDDKDSEEIILDDKSAIFSTGKEFKVGERIMQMIVMPYPAVELEETQDLSSTERGAGGFGSSGK